MKLTAAFAIWPQLVLAGIVGVLPTLRDVLKSPSLLVRPRRLSRVMFANVWAVFGPFVDRKFRGNKEALIEYVKKATGRHELKFGNLKWFSEWRYVPCSDVTCKKLTVLAGQTSA